MLRRQKRRDRQTAWALWTIQRDRFVFDRSDVICRLCERFGSDFIVCRSFDWLSIGFRGAVPGEAGPAVTMGTSDNPSSNSYAHTSVHSLVQSLDQPLGASVVQRRDRRTVWALWTIRYGRSSLIVADPI